MHSGLIRRSIAGIIDYTAQIQGNYKYRIFYSLGGGAEKNELFGTVGTPRIGLAWYPVRPGPGLIHGTKIRFNFANGYQEPSLDEQFGSLYNFLLTQPGGRDSIQQFHITPVVAEQSRTYEGGVAQGFLNERGLLKVSYFHNQYGRQIEAVPATEVPALLPQLSPSEQQTLEGVLSNAGDLDLNSQAFRAQGIESEFDYTVFKNLFLRGGYTYLDAVVERSFTSDALQLLPLIPACQVNRRRRFRKCRSALLILCVGLVRFIGHRIPGMARLVTAASSIGWGLQRRSPPVAMIPRSWLGAILGEGTRCCYRIAIWISGIPSLIWAEAISFSPGSRRTRSWIT